jgi:acyl-CoA thioester hydrolase
MSDYKFYLPLQIRYGDMDAQGHLNNVRFLQYMETTRFAYLVELGLWDGKDFQALGLIVADVHVSYLAPVTILQKIRCGARVSRIGNKSLTFEYILEDVDTRQPLATGETVMVAYDYPTLTSVPVSAEWRRLISAYEAL